MDLEKKTYVRVEWIALWDVLKIYGVGGKLSDAIKSFYEDASACVKISGETSEDFEIKVGLTLRVRVKFLHLKEAKMVSFFFAIILYLSSIYGGIIKLLS